MSKKRNDKTKLYKQRAAQSSAIWVTDNDGFESLGVSGYTSLDKNPEIVTACRRIADLISSMTIHLMANTEKGNDQRIINEMSKKVDINPNKYMTRKTWMDAIVMNLLLYGKGNSVVLPHTKNGLLDDLEPIRADRISFVPDGQGYVVRIDGSCFSPDDVLHFVHNPDKYYMWKGQGVTTALKDVAHNLKQAAATEKGFMQSKWKPSIIVKVDGLTEEFSSRSGREKLLNEYISTNTAGEPWLIPAEQFEIEQIKPLSLSDLALADIVQLDKKTVSSIMGVPAFVLGVEKYSSEEWNAFINNTIRPIVKTIEQELTRKLLISSKWYFRFNVASLYSYDLKTVAEVYSHLYVRGIVDGNEVRDKMNMPPRDGLDELVILENYIPLDKIGDQLKLKDKGT